MDHPGVVVVHEANLHHLIADITIKRGDWDAYMRAVEQEGSAEDLAYARPRAAARSWARLRRRAHAAPVAEPIQGSHRA